jgi:hypothetical protein
MTASGVAPDARHHPHELHQEEADMTRKTPPPEVLDLWRRIKELEHPDGGWPGCDVVDALTQWFGEYGLSDETASTPTSDTARAFPDADRCERANTDAVFHPKHGPGKQSLPCIQVADILAFLYLDPDHQQVRVSVHLDGLDPEGPLTRDDGTVPLRIDVENATVFQG